MENGKPWYVSSTGRGIAATIKGVLIGLIPVLMLVTGVDQAAATDGVNAVVTFIEAAVAAAAAGMVVFGVARKAYFHYVKKYNE